MTKPVWPFTCWSRIMDTFLAGFHSLFIVRVEIHLSSVDHCPFTFRQSWNVVASRFFQVPGFLPNLFKRLRKAESWKWDSPSFCTQWIINFLSYQFYVTVVSLSLVNLQQYKTEQWKAVGYSDDINIICKSFFTILIPHVPWYSFVRAIR
jgi:hypothetical protein